MWRILEWEWENGAWAHGELWSVVCDDGDFGRCVRGDGGMCGRGEGTSEPLHHMWMKLCVCVCGCV